jgi:hypothetical protein
MNLRMTGSRDYDGTMDTVGARNGYGIAGRTQTAVLHYTGDYMVYFCTRLLG